jgi:chromosome segregation ATPase
VKSGDLEIPDAFKQALQGALSRNQEALDNSSRGYDRGSSYSGSSSSSGGGSSSYRPPPSAGRAASEATPLLQVLATALGQSRATLERLQAEEAEIENLIQKERKQVERLEWLLEKVQMDYAYFNQLQKRFEDEAGSASNRW